MTCFNYGQTNCTFYQNEELNIHRDLMYNLFCEQEYIIPILLVTENFIFQIKMAIYLLKTWARSKATD